jgi:cephalosporin hydroxylase
VNLRYVAHKARSLVRPAQPQKPLSVEEIARSSEALGIVERFNDFYYMSCVNGDLNWQGVPVSKNPCDLWMMAELIQRLRPSVIIETGTNFGGSAVFYADMMKLSGIGGTVVTIDVNPKWSIDPRTRKIESLVGYSTEVNTIARVRKILGESRGHTIVVLDSDHSEVNVSEELKLYSGFVTKNSYLVVEDTNVNGHPSALDHGPGPYEAVQKFLSTNKQFMIDRDCERFLLTFNPSGWLKRIT